MVTDEELNEYCTAIAAANLPKPGAYSFMKGSKYARIVETVKTFRQAYCFVQLNTGDLFKVDSWSQPAKGMRGNIRNANRPLLYKDFYVK